MPEPINQPEHGEQTGRGYEQSHVSVGRLLLFGAGVVALVVLGVLGSAFVLHFFVEHEPMGPPASPFENARQMPPAPRLQVDAPADLQQYLQNQNKILGNYGWVDPQAGIVRIPIDQAMSLLLQKGFALQGSSPVNGKLHTPGAAPPPNGLVAPTPVAGGEVR